MAATADLETSLDDGVLTVLINREEKRNALNAAVLQGILAAVSSPREDARVVLVRSAGDRAFCAGADLALMGEDATGLEVHEARGGLREVVLAMRACPLPVVARVQGLCLAGGVGLALGCDIVVCSDAAEWGLPEVDRGLWPFMVSGLLARHVSPKRAMDWMLTGRRFSSTEALEAGLASRVVPADRLDGEIEELVAALAAKAPVAVRLGKQSWITATDAPLEPGLEALQAQLALITTTKDAAEGVAAFFEKRPPRWTGR
ncbi:MAG TPA: enoyl-CoA hydratase-related protein [Mycobacteriales bacterium]|nr:enoyl-CoA hydratase-related protein [Mycobacteriales bacterium]